MKRIVASLLALLIVVFAWCSSTTAESTGVVPAAQSIQNPAEESVTVVNTMIETGPTSTPIVVEYDDDDLASSVDGSDVSYIKLVGDAIAFDGSGATVDGRVITITSSGTYSISGTLADGQILVDTEDEETVVLVLNGADIACSTSAPIYVVNADKVVITLADGTENSVTDGESYVFEDAEADEPNAAIFSRDDLTINGGGSLTVVGNYDHGIVSKDDLKIVGGILTVTAVNDGIKGRDSIAVKDGIITIDAGGDGMQANNADDAEEGTIHIEGGTLNITAGLDGIQAETRLAVSGGTLTISSGGGSAKSSRSTESAKGLKASVDVTISGGTIQIDSSDDAIHSNNSLTIDGGGLLLASGDDGIHSDATLEINGGDIRITQSYEGVESAVLTFNDGNIHIVASDDGINAAGGADGSSVGGRPGQNTFDASMDYHTYINGGYIYIDAMGDGLDSNGPIDMTGGVVLINGPTANNNGPLDYMGAFNITGGFLVAVGSAGMAQSPSPSSTQYSVMQILQSTQAAGTVVHIENERGENLLTFVPTKAYQSVLLSSPELENGVTYTVHTGGRPSGTVTDGLSADGAYTGGIQVASFTVSGMVTGGGATGGFPGRPRRQRP